MANANSTYDLKVEKVIPKTTAEVFRAIGEGRLFLNCSADHESLKIDFKVGGWYSILFVSYGMKNRGEFLEIIPNQKIVFTWCQDYDSNPTPDTKVSIDLKDLGGKTALTLTHTGFTDLESKNAHEGGWSGGLNDLSEEMTSGKLRLARKSPLTVEKLYEACKNPSTFPGAKFLETIPNEKIVFNYNHETKVTLTFESEDKKEDGSWITLVHEGLEKESQQKAQREGWDSLLKRLK